MQRKAQNLLSASVILREKSRRYGGIFLFLFFVLALLICDTAAGLASRLARGLALAATAVLCAVAQVTGLQGFDMFHFSILHSKL